VSNKIARIENSYELGDPHGTVAGKEARLLEAFLAEAPALQKYNLVDVYEVLCAARRALQTADASTTTPADAVTVPVP
jgi:hypothetical protein